jgi:Sulfatase.
MKKSGDYADHTQFQFSLVIVTIAVLLPFKFIFAKIEPPALLLSTWCFEACIFLWIYIAGALLGRIRIARRLHLAVFVFFLLFLAQFIMGFGYAYFFKEATERRLSLLDVNIDSFDFFFSNMLPWYGFVVSIALFVFLILIALFLKRVLTPPKITKLTGWVATISLIMGMNITLMKDFPSPLVDFSNDVVEIWIHQTIKAPEKPIVAYPVEQLNKNVDAEIRIQSSIKKIIVFVLEGAPLYKFFEDTNSSQQYTFFQQYKNSSHSYFNFFTNNQDSRTGLLALLTARFIPFMAYTDEGLNNYRFLSEKKSLVDIMNHNGYETAYAASETEEEQVVFDLPWKHKFILTDDEYEQAKGYLCFNPYQFEHSCEDIILLDRLIDFLKNHEKVFLFQEELFGHCSVYYDVAKKNAVEYGTEYLEQMVNRLKSEHLLDETLIVVTSDHGIRDRGYENNLGVYRIPLIFIHPGYEYTEHAQLLSQIDFKDIVLDELAGNTGSLPDNEFVLFMGPTTNPLFGAITKQHDLLLIKNRRWFSYVLMNANFQDDEQLPAPPKDPDSPYAFMTLLNQYRTYFQSKSFP